MLIVAKLVDYLNAAGHGVIAQNSICNFKKKVELGTVLSGPGKMRFFGLTVEEAKDFTIKTDADDKLTGVREYTISRTRRKQ